MSSIINILPDFIANQIAAGEVVQRPESVVKELVENAVDAGASQVHVTVRDAGKSLIHVVDNGKGMSKEDLLLSIKRHATSKILTQQDLEAIKSFGFRGEALASISAVSKIEIITKQENDDLGWKLISEPNSEPTIEPINTSTGTQIIVKSLFYNTPARRKFLRANLTEYRHILDTINKFSLANIDLALSFYDDNNLIYNLKPENIEHRISNVLGKKVIQNLNEVTFSNDFLKISGFVGSPSIAKVSRSSQYMFLNGRPVNNKSLTHAITSAYGPLLDKNQHPLFIIYLNINPAEVDINVHPQKHEVKFEDERAIYNALKQAVSQTLRGNNITSEFVFKTQESSNPFIQDRKDDLLINRHTGEIIQKENYTPQKTNAPNFQKDYNPPPQRKNDFQPELSAFDVIFGNDSFQKFKNLGYFQVHEKYIVTQIDNGILVIDQHNAHERINYEKALSMLDSEFAKSQQMLFPENIIFDETEKSIFNEISQELDLLGFKFDLNDSGITLQAKPTDVRNGKEESELKEILSLYQENKSLERTEKRENIAASFSCRSSIKTGKKLSLEEMKALHDDLMKCETPEVCPHGRPVIMEITLKELDLQFGRTPKY
jgi:DNA mismatch repair protein MutL